MYDIIIIGAGPAGLTAALYALRCGKKVLVLEGETFGGQITLTPMVENYPATGNISGIEFADKLIEQVTDLGGEIELGTVTEIVDGETKTVVTEDDRYEAKAVIIAAGVKHRALGLPNEEELIGSGVSYCAVCDGAFYKDKIVSVVGGGSTALTDALYLATMCKKVYLIHRRDTFRGEESLVKKVKEKENIELILNSEVTALNGGNILNSVEVVNTAGEKSIIETSALFVMIGQKASNDIFANIVELDEYGFIVTDLSCKTKTKGIFAAGDCRVKDIRQLTTATADGTIAALAACEYVDGE